MRTGANSTDVYGPVDQAVAQVRKWAGHPDNGWAPDRQQCTALADEVESLRARLAATGAERDRLAAGVRRTRVILDEIGADGGYSLHPAHLQDADRIRAALDEEISR